MNKKLQFQYKIVNLEKYKNRIKIEKNVKFNI